MRLSTLLLAGLALSTVNSYAEDYDSASASCSRLAAHPDEPGYEGKGVYIEKIDTAAAMAPCTAAAFSDKALGKDMYHLYRVHLASGQTKSTANLALNAAATAGYAFAQYKLARELLEGDEPHDYVAGRYWLTQAAYWYPPAQASLGYMEWYGLGGPVDRDAAIDHEKSAAENGDELGSNNLSAFLSELAAEQDPVDANGQTYNEALEEVQRQEAEQRKEIERQNCQFYQSGGPSVSAWAGCN
ncbi:hypothetical protein ASD64_12715 [Mesorhizobium sp. Root157]|uniref:SEL1-like repeat protein n=1 Tax=Mesorhizobium sp. Root157 TaxID=1736477 RepID=UPI000701F6D8|nr:SEL1-like repeat protein [Mesorhizobium sp. Root157]KQZ78203.1 hypothetical protein ASD64_12715 [Mesorhizobium sp. Root157]